MRLTRNVGMCRRLSHLRGMLVLTIAATGLSGCAEWQATRAGIADHGAQASDAALQDARWWMCNASPVGALRRSIQSPRDLAAWQQLCREPAFDPGGAPSLIPLPATAD
jgi:hypothetical protein